MTWESIVNNCDLLLFACFSKPQKSSRLGNMCVKMTTEIPNYEKCGNFTFLDKKTKRTIFPGYSVKKKEAKKKIHIFNMG